MSKPSRPDSGRHPQINCSPSYELSGGFCKAFSKADFAIRDGVANWLHRKKKTTRKQKAINVPKIIPSLLFFAPILCIKPLIPGI